MKMTRRIALGTAALALCGALFFSCSNSAGGNPLALTGNTPVATGSQPTQGGGSGQTQSPATISYNKLWEGSKTMAWSGDENCVVIDHAVFSADFDSLRVTYNASAGAIKLAACDPWTELKPAAISDGSIGADGALNLPTGDNQTVTVKLSDSDVALIKGQGKDDAWGGVKIFGADTVTLLKVESFKAAASATPATQTTTPEQTQTQPQTQDPGLLFESSEGWTEDWKAKTFEAAKFAAAVTGSQIKFTVRKNTDKYVNPNGATDEEKYKDCYSLIQLLDKVDENTTNKLTGGTITGGEIEAAGGNLKPAYKNTNGTDDYDESHVFTMVYTPSAAEIDILKTKGVGVQAHGTRILKIEFVAAPANK